MKRKTKKSNSDKFTLLDHLFVARALLWVVNEVLILESRDGRKNRVAFVADVARIRAAMDIIEGIAAEQEKTLKRKCGGGLPPGRGGAVLKFYKAVLEGYDGHAVHLPDSSMSVGPVSMKIKL